MKTKHRTKDLDQIYNDKQPENINRCINEATKIDEDKPALGQNFCMPCDKYFCDEKALQAHLKQKPHKRRMKALETEPHSQEIADWAAGVASRKRNREMISSVPHKKKATYDDAQVSMAYSEAPNRGEPNLEQTEDEYEQSYLAVD
ncbi:unnamed protein product [Rodentolepis nana]|uniref:C2H2-type domain-containing protein n=1 Tax=Rodentolepis nana TaxID=102285 RepID=A0A0R3TLS4_RODNA|nr:unnamed protein product [Rodentolepis nana]